MILKNKNIFNKIEMYDMIIPVPISNKRYKNRGYNQSALISKEISKNTSIIYEENILIKNKDIIEQSKLNKNDRIKNVKNVYSIKNGENIYNRKILLVDDIYTTGSTVEECCRMIKKFKPMKIGVMVLAKD